MSSITYPNKTTALALNEKAIDGVDKYLSHVKTLTFGGTSYTPAAIKGVLQAELDANTAADEGQAQYRQQVVAAKLARSNGRTMRKALKGYILSYFGGDAVQTLQAFGFNVPKTGLKSAQSKAEAAAQGKATRAKRKEALASADATPPSANAQLPANVTPPKS